VATRTGHPKIERRRQATAIGLHKRNGKVSLRHVVDDARRSVRRAIVHHNGLMASQRLVLNALERATNRGGIIARGNDNRDDGLPVHGAWHILARLSSPKTVPEDCVAAPPNVEERVSAVRGACVTIAGNYHYYK
jgi:hypothetical protein